jgi:hypothetical protein
MNEMSIAPSSATIRYDEMCRSIAAAYEVDEVEQLMDQAAAIEVDAPVAEPGSRTAGV